MQLLFPWEEAIAVVAETWASVLFPQHLEGKQNRTNEKHTREMLYYHHPHLLRSGTTLCLGRTSPTLSLSRAVWLYKADTLSFPVRSFQRNLLLFPPSLIPSSWPQPWLYAPAAMLCLLNRMERWAASARNAGATCTHAHRELTRRS